MTNGEIPMTKFQGVAYLDFVVWDLVIHCLQEQL